MGVDHLYISPCEIQINRNTSYKLGIIQIYNNHETPRVIRQINREGGMSYDVDCYGIQDRSIPGNTFYTDIFQEEQDKPNEWYKLQDRKTDLEEKIRRCPFRYKTDWLKVVNERIEDIECKRRPFELQQIKEDPPYTHYLQLIITSSNGRKVEKVVYNKKINEAMKAMFEKLFGKKKFGLESLKIQYNVKEAFDLIRPYLVRSLKHLEINRTIERDSIIANAQRLTICELPPETSLPLISNSRVHFQEGSQDATELVDFCEALTGEDLKHYSVEIRNRERAVEVFDRYLETDGYFIGEIQETKGTSFPLCITLPKSDVMEINIYLEGSLKIPESGDGVMDVYIFHVKLNPKGYCQELEEGKRPKRSRDSFETEEVTSGTWNFIGSPLCIILSVVFFILILVSGCFCYVFLF